MSKATAALLEIRQSCTHRVMMDVLDKIEFGLTLRNLRQDKNISLRDMAGRLKISAPFLSDVELGLKKLRLSSQVEFMRQITDKDNV